MDAERKAEGQGKRRAIEVLLLVLFIAFISVLLLRRPLKESETLASMPEPERKALFEKEREAFRALCIEGPGDKLDGRCPERADFLQKFPECDATCRTQTNRFLSQPAR